MEKKENIEIVTISLKTYSIEAVYGAAYLFFDKLYLFLEEEGKNKIKITIKKKDNIKEDVKKLKDEFLNELLSSSIRIVISKKNRRIREYVIVKALTSSLSRESNQYKEKDVFSENKEKDVFSEEFKKTANEEWDGDTEGISMTWEEKYLGEKDVSKVNIWQEDKDGFAVPVDSCSFKEEEIKTVPWRKKTNKTNKKNKTKKKNDNKI